MANPKAKADAEKELAPGAQELEQYFEGQELAEHRRQNFNVVKADDFDAMLPDSWESALAAMESIGATISRSDEDLADEFPLIDKERLVNVECMFLTWSISMPNSESYGTPYIVVRGIRRDGRRFRFTDGSTGICAQLMKLTEKRIREGFAVPNAGLQCVTGLRKSEYDTVDSDGNEVHGVTFYIDNQPAD